MLASYELSLQQRTTASSKLAQNTKGSYSKNENASTEIYDLVEILSKSLETLSPFNSYKFDFTSAAQGTAVHGEIRDFPGIESIPGVIGGDPVIIRTRIPVWLLVQARQEGVSDTELLRAYPSLRPQDLTNVWTYYESHKDEVDRQIEENENA